MDESARNATAANLAAAGYGGECPGGPEPGALQRAAEGPCYVRLYLRQAGDTRLASVYKPAQREDLRRRGFKLVGRC
jgi:hypothetical protein